MNSSPAAPASRRSRLLFWVAAVLFLGPFIAAFVIYRWYPELLPTDRTNYGQLIDPPRPLPDFTFVDPAGKEVVADELDRTWSLVYLGDASCEASCRERLIFARQLWLSLNDKRTKIKRVYVAPDAEGLAGTHAALGSEHVDQQWLAGTGTTGYQIRRFFEMANANALYLVDPLGNWVMTYVPASGDDATQRDFKGMQKDLKKLLKLG